MTVADFKWPRRITLASGSGVGVTVISSWGKPLAADTGMAVRIALTGNTAERMKWAGLGLADLTAGGTSNSGMMLEGEGPYAARDSGPYRLRAVWAQSSSASGFFTRGDSAFATPRDIKPGTRLVDMTYVGSQKIVEGLLAWAGVSRDDVVWVPAADAKQKNQLILDAEADIAFGTPTAASMYAAEESPHGIKWLDLNSEQDPEGAARFLVIDPLIGFTPIPIGVPSSLGVWGAGGTSFYCGTDKLDTGLAYNLAKWLDTNWARFKDAHEWNRYMTRQTVLAELPHTFIPVHEGLIAYLDELGLWSDAHQRRNQENIALADAYCDAWAEALDRADESGVPVTSDNPDRLALWAEVKTGRTLPKVKMFLGLDA